MANLLDGATIYSGQGQAGNLSDPNNWVGGQAPGLNGFALITSSAVLNGSFTSNIFMGLGEGTVTVNGTLTTTSANPCKSVMVCNHSNFVFTPGAVMNDAGGFIVGAISAGTFLAESNATTQSHINTGSVKIGQDAGGNGVVTINGATLTDSQNMYVGQNGQGVLTITDGGLVSVAAGLAVGAEPGAVGSVDVTNASTYAVQGGARIGGGAPDAPGGVGVVTVGNASSFSVGGLLQVSTDGNLNLAGGTVTAGGAGGNVWVAQGGNITGFGALAQTAPGGTINDGGSITASGGTLALSGQVVGVGTLDIGANSTVQVTGATIGVASIAFAGPDARLSAQAISSHTMISGFAAGDSLLLSGATALSWDANHDVLTVGNGSQVLDQLHFAGNYAGETFSLSHAGNEAVISVGPVLTHH